MGKNKIEKITGLEGLQNLKQLDIQNNRLTVLEGLDNLVSLQELYLACNAISSLEGLPANSPTLTTIDLSANKISNIDGIQHISSLEEFWLSSNQVSDLHALQCLTQLESLQCLYMEHNPIAKGVEGLAQYKSHIVHLLPKLKQLDADIIAGR